MTALYFFSIYSPQYKGAACCAPTVHRSPFTFHRFEVFLPFHREEVLFPAVALLAGRHHVPTAALAAAGDRDDVVHGELGGGKGAAAPVADSFGEPVLPPARPAQLPGLILFPFDLLFGELDDENVHLE